MERLRRTPEGPETAKKPPAKAIVARRPKAKTGLATKTPQTAPETDLLKDETAVGRIHGRPFAKGAGDLGEVDPNDVAQGALGDCYLMAALAAVAKTDPDIIR